MKNIADTGLLKAALDRDDEAHAWAVGQLREHAPFHTGEPVLDEPRCKVWTVDKDDFQIYRRHGRHAVPCEFPPDRS